MKENEIVWTRAQMFDALRTYQIGLSEIQQHVETLAERLDGPGLTSELRVFIDQMLGTVVSTTVEVAAALGD